MNTDNELLMWEECGHDWFNKNYEDSDEEKFEWLNETLLDDQLPADLTL
jgi:hypothetical protein